VLVAAKALAMAALSADVSSHDIDPPHGAICAARRSGERRD
jgi:hypothetical protein